MRTIEAFVADMADAKVFSVLDANHCFLQIHLDEESSFFTTFNTHFRRYRWLRLSHELKLDKGLIRQWKVPYVGHLLTASGLLPDPSKLEAIKSMSAPSSKEGIRWFLGFVTYLSKFIPNLGEEDAPLLQLMESDAEFIRQPAQQESFTRLKDLCCP